LAEIIARYDEAHRAYHTLTHISNCLGWLDATLALAERPDELALALVYHDVVYDPWRSDNEQLSAQLFREHARVAELPGPARERICTLIVGTATHAATSGDGALLNDIDLAVLGAEPAEYEVFEANVQREYAAVARPLFLAGRQRVLRSFLERPAIYATAFFAERLEARARRNLSAALVQLQRAENEAGGGR
jgi:predicted metal-dependent HD superfamily phosphohydrolase